MSQYESYYGGGGGGGGGGFLQGGSPYSQGGSPGGQKNETNMSLRPITGSQFNQTTQTHGDAPWTLEGVEIGQVTLIGQVITMQQQTTNHIYTIEDGTGRVEARHWVGTSGSTEAEAEKWSGIEEGMYVRVGGFVKSFGNKKYIKASHMKPVEDFNEIYFHMLECITTTLILERGPPYNAAGQKKINTGSAQHNNNAMDTRDEWSDLTDLEQKIVRYILAQPNAKDGVNINMIARAIGKTSSSSAEDISAALDTLMDNGTLYNTSDDSHFAVSQ